MGIDLHPEAQAEFIEAASYYEERVPGLGEKFVDELESLEALLAANPEIGASMERPFRQLLFRRFPLFLNLHDRKREALGFGGCASPAAAGLLAGSRGTLTCYSNRRARHANRWQAA